MNVCTMYTCHVRGVREHVTVGSDSVTGELYAGEVCLMRHVSCEGK